MNVEKESMSNMKKISSQKANKYSAEKVIICGVCRDVENALSAVISSMEETGKLFEDYRICVYENNSRDNTPAILNEWKGKSRRVHLTTENIPEKTLLDSCKAISWDNKPYWLELIAGPEISC